MSDCLAFVLGGGGARGAMQVGALRALLEAGLQPDLLVGTSIGAVNATGLALWGADQRGIDMLQRTFDEVEEANLMDPRLPRLALRALSGRPSSDANRRVRAFLMSRGLAPDLRFDQVGPFRLALIGSDLDTGQVVIYGEDVGQRVLDGLMASIALPPWFAPVEEEGHVIMDGGALSNLPIEPAMKMGATKIIALDLDDPRALPGQDHVLGQYLAKLVFAVSRRHVALETDLVEVQGIPVHRIALRSPTPVPIWDFTQSRTLIEIGYGITSQQVPKIRAMLDECVTH